MNVKNPKERLDKLLVDKGFAQTRNKAQAMILAGQVLVNNIPVTKAGQAVQCNSQISLKATNPYVSRGGLKLEAALKGLNIQVSGKVCMDIGASTGGFTDCLLQHGAKKVYAMDVGHHQLDMKLRSDPRVINREGINFRYFQPETLNEPIEFATIDVSFISLDKIIPIVVECLCPDGEILALVKPQFEASPAEVKKGVVRDESVRLKTIDKIKSFGKTLSLVLKGEIDSPIRGPEGNLEHFLWFAKKAGEMGS
jgi:23S rRNA (cytidine1920-2'-O)/16S rRNA (cytidine1409-2'-O)-methyltransferase